MSVREGGGITYVAGVLCSYMVTLSLFNMPYSSLTHLPPTHTHTHTEVDGVRQVSPDSPSKPLVPETPTTKVVIEEKHAADDMSVSLTVPNMRTRKNSDVTRPNPR